MNWKQEAVEHLQKYDAMQQAIKSIPSEILRLEQAAQSIGAARPDQPRVKKSISSGEDRMINHLIQKQELERSFENARLWVYSTDRALDILTPDERTILLRMYVNPQRGVVASLCETLGVEQSTIYRKRDAALYRFTLALYGAA